METGIFSEIRSKLDYARAGKPMLFGMAMLLVVVAVAAGLVLSGAATSSNYELSHASDQASDSEALEETVFVHVSGAVSSPGLYELAQGSRVADAVTLAGGFADDADSESCNLARVIEDGEHIVIAVQADPSAEGGQYEQATYSAGNASSLVNLNTATTDELEALPGIGASTASKIVSDRQVNGPFSTVSDLTRVSGIGEKKLAALEDLVCV